MNITKMKADLYCLDCNKDTLHEVTYMGDSIEKITCLECEATLEIDEKIIVSTYVAEIFNRVRTKPERMSKESKADLSKFLRSIPFRVVTKPYRMIKEYKTVKEISHE